MRNQTKPIIMPGSAPKREILYNLFMDRKIFFPALILSLALLSIATGAYFQNLLRPDMDKWADNIDYRQYKPPAPWMTVNDLKQQAEVGTFCWTKEFISVCADAVGIPTPSQPLVFASSETPFLFHFQLHDVAAIADLAFYYTPISSADALSEAGADPIWWPYWDNMSPIFLEPAHTVTVELTLPPGLYVFNLFAIWEGQGDGSFGYLVEIR